MVEFKSWYLEQYPMVNCDDCGEQHFKFPKLGGDDPFIPIELINMGQLEHVPTGKKLPFLILAYGIPTTEVPATLSTIYLQ